ncbi:hypothetical protein ACLKMH_05955 [Psychromonas sp. KJ10-10]|uniref:hypothetical protein n=1 Tax=Psychromonas sp. KJ10-10 TaxID=3391823 RepID=UPI0039B3DCBE
MKKIMLAVLLSTFLCHSALAKEKAEYVEDYSEMLQQEAHLENEFADLEPEYIEYEEPEFIESEYDESVYRDATDISEQGALLESTTDNVLSILASCKEYTLEDGVEEKDLNKYLFICINNILNENGYKSIKSLPIE